MAKRNLVVSTASLRKKSPRLKSKAKTGRINRAINKLFRQAVWPPVGWESPWAPASPELECALQWLDEQIQAIGYHDALHRGTSSGAAWRDTLRLLSVFDPEHGMVPPSGRVSAAHEVMELKRLKARFVRTTARKPTHKRKKTLLPKRPPAPPSAEFLSAAALATHLGQDVDAVESFLRRYRKKHLDCYEETDTPRRNEARILYRVPEVWPALLAHRWRKSK